MEWKKQLSKALDNWIHLSMTKDHYTSIREELKTIKEDLNDELIVMIAGEFKAGKSTFINALLGSEIVTSDVTPATAVVTKLTYGQQKKVLAHFLDGTIKEYNEEWLEQLTAERSGKFSQVRQQLSFIELQLPIELLKTFTVVDTPGLNSSHEHHTYATERFLKRADVAIWLFSYRNVGTNTEVEWLRKLYEHKIKPIPIVNGIDMHDDDEGDLEDVLDFNYRKLHPLVDRLIGVSAREALQGKMENDNELLEWSNWKEIDDLFKSFEELASKKAERIFQKLAVPLKQLNEHLLEEKSVLALHRFLPLIQSLVQNDAKLLEALRENTNKLEDERNDIIKAWDKNSPKHQKKFEDAIIGIERLLDHISLTTKEQDGSDSINNKWDHEILPEINQYKKGFSKYETQIEEKKRERQNLQEEWGKLEQKRYFKKKKVQNFIAKQDEFNRTNKILSTQKRDIAKGQQNLLKSFVLLEKEISSFINNDILGYSQALKQAVNEWNKQLEAKQKHYDILTDDVVRNIQTFFDWLYQFKDNVIYEVQFSDQEITSLMAYKECEYLLTNIASLHEHLPLKETTKYLQKLRTYEKQKVKEYKFNMKSLGPSELFKKVPQEPETLVYTASKELEKISEKRRSLVVGYAILLLVIGGGATYAFTNDSTPKSVKEPAPITYTATTSDVIEEMPEPTIDELYSGDDFANYLNQLHHTKSNYSYADDFPYDDFMTMAAWYSFYDYYNIVIDGYAQQFEMQSIEYIDEVTAIVQTRELYEVDGFEKDFQLVYTFTLLADDHLIIELVSYSLLHENELEVPVAEEDIVSFLNDFRTDYFYALNYEDFRYVSPYLQYGGPAYNELSQYVSDISGRGLTFDSDWFEITDLNKISTNLYVGTSYEEFTFIDAEGQKILYERIKEYKVKVNVDRRLEIQDITITNTKKEEVIVPTVHYVSYYDITDFLNSYYYYFVEAFNGQGFSYVDPFYSSNTDEYNATMNYIDNALEKQMHMTNYYFEVESVHEYDPTHYQVTVYIEDEYFYQDGSGDYKKLYADYLVEVTTNGQLFIKELLNIDIIEKIDY
ncbi:TcaA NTF2-like domain-containing protein [Alkalihalobacterium sp. APHAB7]|uniref:TcaA NTF2-like domain-containing protein n=1 Tax=Alkalihalobacterium sp. APHAB7 TaxID=3402081 RepID=UPI003AACCC91